VACELRNLYAGSVASTERFQLSSAAVWAKSYWLRGPRSYGLLVLNSELEVPSGDNDPQDLAARLNQLLDGKGTVTGTIPLKEPAYGSAVILSALAILLSGLGALLLLVAFFGRRPSSPARN
jgi:hypothetical protein